MEDADEIIKDIGLPVIVRFKQTPEGKGTGIAETVEQFSNLARNGLSASPIHEIPYENQLRDGKQYELEVMRDNADNCVVVCAIENGSHGCSYGRFNNSCLNSDSFRRRIPDAMGGHLLV